VVSAHAAGEATITATAADGSGKTGTAQVTVNLPNVPVTSITIGPAAVTLNAGTPSIELEITILPDDATNKAVTWVSSDPTKATVSQSGVVTMIAPGTANITATAQDSSGKQSNVCAITVDSTGSTPVSSVTIDTAPQTPFYPGDTQPLTATVDPPNATFNTVTWSSSDTAKVSVDQFTGEITAHAVTTTPVTITATADSQSDTCTVTVSPRPVTSISIPTTASLAVGDSITLTPTINPANATNPALNWVSSNTSVATVTQGGAVTAVAVGEAIITAAATATENSGKSATCTVTVTPRLVTSITIPTTASLTVGETDTLSPVTINPSNATNQTLAWSSDTPAVASVDPATGLITAVAVGQTTITAESTDGSNITSNDCTVTVTTAPPAPVSSITLDPSSPFSLFPGNTRTISATVNPSNAANKNLYWSSSDLTKVTVTQSGVVTAVAVGTATITADATDSSGKSASVQVTVAPQPVTGITVSPSDLEMALGTQYTLSANVSPPNAANKVVTWQSSDPSKVNVNQSTGEISAVGATSTPVTITATAQDGSGETGSAQITVTAGSGMLITFTGFSNEQIDLTAGGSTLSMSDYNPITVTINGIDANSVLNMAYTVDGGYLRVGMMGPPWTITLYGSDFNVPGVHRLDVIMEVQTGPSSSVLYSKKLLFTVVQ
jgi:uncharacterized protein YjdB